MVAACKAVGLSLRKFESCSCHMKHEERDYFGARCRTVSTKWVWVDLDTRRGRFGFCLGGSFGRARTIYDECVVGGSYELRGPSWCLDVRAPLGEPHRLYLTNWLGLSAVIGLWPGHGSQGWSWRRNRPTSNWHWVVVRPATPSDRNRT